MSTKLSLSLASSARPSLASIPPMLSSCNLLPPWWHHLNRGRSGNGTELLAATPSSIASSSSSLTGLPPKEDVGPTSFSVELNILNNEWRGQWAIIWWIYMFIHISPNYLNLSLIIFYLPAMTSACISKDTLSNNTQVFLKYKIFIFEICLHLINFNFTPYFLTSLTQERGYIKPIPPDEKRIIITRNTNHFLN